MVSFVFGLRAILISVAILLAPMAAYGSTVTPNKGYIEPTVGSDANVWGTYLNNNLSVQDKNLGGVAAIAVTGGTDTLTASEAQNLVLKFTGTLTSNETAKVPASGSFYIVDNETTGAYTLTVVTTAGGSTGAVIPQGTRWYVYSDGTNVYPGNLEDMAQTYGRDSGTASAYVLTPSVTVGALFDGLTVTFQATHTSAAGATLNVGGLGAKNIYKMTGSGLLTLGAGDIYVSGSTYPTVRATYLSALNSGAGGWIVTSPLSPGAPSTLITGSAQTAWTGGYIVATGALTLTLPTSTTLSTDFRSDAYAYGGAITVSLNSGSDKINGGSAGSGITISSGNVAHISTDGAGNYYISQAIAGGYAAQLNGLTLSQGDILYYNGSALTNLGAGTSGQYLQTQGTSANPQWAPINAVGTTGITQLAGSSAGGGVTASWTANAVVACTSLSGTCYKGTSLSLSFNGATTGAGGMDTGSVPTSGSLCVYAITKGEGTWNTLGYSNSSCATIYAGAHMPSGYTASVLIWAGITDGSAHIQKFGQVGSKVFEAPINVLSITSSVPTSFTSVSLTSALPANAVVASGILGQPSGNLGLAAVAADTSGTGEIIVGGQNGSAVSAVDNFTTDTGMFAIPLTTASTLYYKSALSTAPVRISITGYTLPIGAN